MRARQKGGGGRWRRSNSRWYSVLYVQVLIAIVLGVAGRVAFPAFCPERLDQGDGRRLRQAHQDGDRADHLLHGRLGHRPHPGRQEGRPRRRQGAGLFRDRLDVRAAVGPDRRQSYPGRPRRRRRARTPRPSPPSPRRRPVAGRSISFSISSRTARSAPLRRATYSRSCCSRFCSALR